MTAEERYKITSNDYVDILVEYGGNEAILNSFVGGTPHIINYRFAAVYLPSIVMSGRALAQLEYAVIPNAYGLESEVSLRASGVLRIREAPVFGLRGEGVLIGIIDTGIDYTNPVFMHPDGSSRIVSIWDQTIESRDAYPEAALYGTEYNSQAINEALASPDPLSIVPSYDEIGHGTMLAGIAAGSEDPANGFSGVVPEAELVVVKLKQAKPIMREIVVHPLDVPCYIENDILWGLRYLLQTARELNRPMVICLGIGTSQGAHDGRDILSTNLNVLADLPGIVVVVSGGNEGNLRRHFSGNTLPLGSPVLVELNVGENENDFSVEIWGDPPGTYSIDLTSPGGEYIPRIAEGLRVSRDITFVFEATRLSVEYFMVEAQTGEELILLKFINPAPGIWSFNIYGRGDLAGHFNIWLPMGAFITENTFFLRSDPYTIITTPGNARTPITVTAYNPINDQLYRQSGRGFTRINIIKPSIVAPGVDIPAPNTEHGYGTMTGSGAAAAHTAGITAMLLEWGIVRGNYPGMDTKEVRKFLIRGARRRPNLQYPNRDWGYGIVDIYNVYNFIRGSL